jgi:hypothetical protein
VRLHKHDPSLHGSRRQADTAGFQAAYRQHRPTVERSIAWLTRGNRKLRYAGWPTTTCGCTTGSRRSTCGGSSPSASPDETGSGCWPELNAGIEDRLTAQHRERDISPTDRTHLVVAHADPTGPQRRPTRELCRQLERSDAVHIQRSPRRWLLSAGRGPSLGCAVADCAASGL